MNSDSGSPNEAPEQPPEERREPLSRPPVDVSALPSLPSHPRSQRTVGTNMGRWATFGCVAVLLVLVVLLMIGVNLTKRTVWMSYARAQQRVVEELGAGAPSGERLRTERNLQRFRARLESSPDPFPLMGRFLGMVSASLEDDRLTEDELAELNRFMEDAIEDVGGDSK